MQPGTIKLEEVVSRLETLDEYDIICVRRPWSPSSECVLAEPTDTLAVPAAVKDAGYEYFMEVFIALETLEVFGTFSQKPPTLEEKIRLLIHYAEYDCYPQWIENR